MRTSEEMTRRRGDAEKNAENTSENCLRVFLRVSASPRQRGSALLSVLWLSAPSRGEHRKLPRPSTTGGGPRKPAVRSTDIIFPSLRLSGRPTRPYKRSRNYFL